MQKLALEMDSPTIKSFNAKTFRPHLADEDSGSDDDDLRVAWKEGKFDLRTDVVTEEVWDTIPALVEWRRRDEANVSLGRL